MQAVQLSTEFLLAVKLEKDYTEFRERFVSEKMHKWLNRPHHDADKKTFWINIYNAFFQIMAQEKGPIGSAIYKMREIDLGDYQFSLDDIEHGILRKHRWKWSMGHLANPFASSTIKKLAVQKIDPRIHFALNCGAKSCPPISSYQSDKIDEQLEIAERNFLTSETHIDEQQKIVKTSKLLLWYKGDFGGKKAILKRLSRILDKDLSNYKLQFSDYSWERDLANYVEE